MIFKRNKNKQKPKQDEKEQQSKLAEVSEIVALEKEHETKQNNDIPKEVTIAENLSMQDHSSENSSEVAQPVVDTPVENLPEVAQLNDDISSVYSIKPEVTAQIEETGAVEDVKPTEAKISEAVVEVPVEADKTKSNKIQKPKKKHKKLRVFMLSLLVLFVLILGFIGAGVAYFLPPITSMKESIDKIQAEASGLKQDLSTKDFTKLTTRITNVDTELKNIREKLNKFDFMKDVSFLSPYYKNIEVVKEILDNSDTLIVKVTPKIDVFVKDLQASIDSRVAAEKPPVDTSANAEDQGTVPEAQLSNAEKCVAQLKDNADLQALGLDSQKLADDKKNERSGGNTKIRDMISVLPEGIDIYNEIEPDLLVLLKSINKLDPKALPSFTPSKYTDALNTVLTTTKDLESNFPKYTELIKRVMNGLPDLLGSKKPVTYLVVFQNEKEMRASGGLLTAYGVLTLDKGKVVGDITTRDMWDLQGDSWKYGVSPYKNIYGQRVLMENGCGATELRSQDSGIYPDLQVSMQMFLTYYDKLASVYPSKYSGYDNVIILNTFFASDMVSLVEPLIMDDCQVITGSNLAKTIFAERNDSAGRKSNIGVIAKMAESEFSSIPSDKISNAADTLIKTIQAKNIAFFSKDPTMEQYFDDLGLTGRIVQDYNGDYFHLNEAQVCGLKANFYLYDIVTQNINIADNGSVSKAINVHWQMDQVWNPNEDEIMSISPRFPYRAWIRVMAPKGTVFTGTDGYEKSKWLYQPVTYFDAVLSKQVSDNIIWFNHIRATEAQTPPTYELNVTYNLPSADNYSDENGYKMLVQKHPGKKDEKYVVNLSFKGQVYKAEFALDRDKVVTFNKDQLKVENYQHPLDDYSELLQGMLNKK